MRHSLSVIMFGAIAALILGGWSPDSSLPSPHGAGFAWNGQGRCAGGGRLPTGLSGYKLTFDDEFDSFAAGPGALPNLFYATWETKYFWGDRSLPQNGETQFYSDSSVSTNPFSLHDGVLDIVAAPGGNAAGLPYNSGMITSYRSFAQTYGYFEMQAVLPQGKGMWPAFWLLPKNGQAGEIDIMEAFGAPNDRGEGGSNQIHWANHYDTPSDTGDWVAVPADIYSGCHSYGVDWEPDTITWYFDGRPIAQVATPALAHAPMYVLANLAAGGTWPGPAGGETAHLQIDYIRVYQKPGR